MSVKVKLILNSINCSSIIVSAIERCHISEYIIEVFLSSFLSSCFQIKASWRIIPLDLCKRALLCRSEPNYEGYTCHVMKLLLLKWNGI